MMVREVIHEMMIMKKIIMLRMIGVGIISCH